MQTHRLKNVLARIWGPSLLQHLPRFRRLLDERQRLIKAVPSLDEIQTLFKSPLVASRLSACISIRYHRLSDAIPSLLEQLAFRRVFIERIHLYATLRSLGHEISVNSSPNGHRWLLTTDGPRQFEHSCEEHTARMERAIELLLNPTAEQEHSHSLETLDLRGLSRKHRLYHLQHIGLISNIYYLPSLLQWLFRTDIDPGHGFALRSTLVEAIGRMGFPVGVWLARALEQEAFEFEGRPGAGLGIQRPVRSHILRAFGESEPQSSSFLPLICQYLENTTGAASGGFYIESMNVLWKWRHPHLFSYSHHLSESSRLNALSVCTTYLDETLLQAGRTDHTFLTEAKKIWEQGRT